VAALVLADGIVGMTELAVCMVTALASTPSLAADTDQGKAIAKRWCATCHLVDR